MADSKGSPSRFRSLRDSVKHITKRLSEGEADVIHRNNEQAREIEKLRVQIQSMEEEIRRLYQSRYQLDQATKQNEKLVSTLQEGLPQRAQTQTVLARQLKKQTDGPWNALVTLPLPARFLYAHISGDFFSVSGNS